MGLYSSLSLVGAMAVSALIAVWLFYKRSHRDDFPEETWDPYFDKNENGGEGGPEREIDEISGEPAAEPAAEAGLEPADEEPVTPASTALADRIQGLREEPPSPGEGIAPGGEFEDTPEPADGPDSGFEDQVELIAGGPVSPENSRGDLEKADLSFAPDEAEGDSPAPGSPIETPAYSQSAPPDLSGEAATAPPGAPWWEGLPAPKEVFFRRGVAELMGVTVIDPPPQAEAGPGEASVPEASTFEAPAPEASTLEAPETVGAPADTAADSIAPDEAGEAGEPPASEFTGASPFGEEDSETPLSLEEEAFEEEESPFEEPAPEEQVSLTDESAPAPEISAADESDDSSFTLESISLGDEPDEAPVMYEPEGAPSREEEGGGFAEPAIQQEEMAGEESSGPETLETSPSFEEKESPFEEFSPEEPAPEEPVSLTDESAPAPEIPAADESDDSSFTLESISLGDEPDEAPVMYEPEGESAPAPAEDEEISLSSPADSESSEAIDNFLSQAEPPSSASAGLVDDEIEPAPEAEGEISPEPEDESYSDLGESEEMPMAFDLDAGRQDFIESDEPVQELPDGLEDGKFESGGAEEFSEAPSGVEEESASGPGEEAPPAGLMEQIPEDPVETTLDSSELEEEPAEVVLDPGELEEEPAEATLDPGELEEESAEATLDPGELEEEPGSADGEPTEPEEISAEAVLDPLEMEEESPEQAIDLESFGAEAEEPTPEEPAFAQPEDVPSDEALPAAEPEGPAPEESLDVFSVLEQERAETPEAMPQESIGNAALFEDFGDERVEPAAPEPFAAERADERAGAGADTEDAFGEELVSEEIAAQHGETGAEAPREEKQPVEETLEPAAPSEPASPPIPLSGESMPDMVRNFVADCCPDDLLLIEEEWDTLPAGIDKIAAAGWRDIQERLESRQEVGEEEFLRIGILEYLMGNHDAALAHLKESLRRAKRMGPVLNALGVTSFGRGKIDPAISYCREAVREAGPDLRLLVAINRNLGVLYQSKGEFGRAAEATASAIKYVGSEGSTRLLANLHLRAGQLFRKLGDAEAARHHLSESAHLFLREGDDAARIRSLVALAAAQTGLNEVDAALKNLNEAALMCRRVGDKNGEALVMGQMGIAYSAQEQYTRALEYYENAISLNRELENRKGEGANLSNIGNIHYFRGDLDEALSAYEEALVINKEQDHLIGQATIMGNLGRIYLEQGRVEEAIERLNESLEIFRPFAAKSQMENIREMLDEAVRSRDQ